MERHRTAVSIVTVWNNAVVRQACLDHSLETLGATAPDTEYLPVDNRGQRHTTAGAALNEGVRNATKEVVVFIQQDIRLHSLTALEEAAARLLADPTIRLAGAVGTAPDGRVLGRIRDRVVLIGERHLDPVDVDSLDEVLFMARRSDLLADPLSEDDDLAWHAYAVEWGLRGRALGQRVVAMDMPLTHNSLSTNLARLDDAHAAVSARHPGLMPVQTTCGRITVSGGTQAGPKVKFLAGHRWRWRWLKASWAVRPAAGLVPSGRVVLGDLRRDIDRIAALVEGRLRIHNVLDEAATFCEPADGTTLPRAGYEVTFSSGPVPDWVGATSGGDATVVTNLGPADLEALRPALASVPHLLGHHDDIGSWLLVGEVAAQGSEIWNTPASRPARLLV